MTITEFLSRLEGVKPTGKSKWKALCPAHDDHDQSLSITEAESKLLIYCFATCTPKQILNSLNLTFRDLFPDNPEDIYQYRDSKGSLSHEKVKYRDAKGNKTFTQRHITPEGKLLDNIIGVVRIPYNYPAVRQAIRFRELVLILEGEKDCDTARLLGYTGTTFGGVSEWKDKYKAFFKRARVAIIPDKDKAGVELAQKIGNSLLTVCQSVKVAILPKGKDLTEMIEAGYGRPHLDQAIREAPELVRMQRERLY